MSGLIYVFRCLTCEWKGATNAHPVSDECKICTQCGEVLEIEIFSDVFFNL